jgi:dihydroorotase
MSNVRDAVPFQKCGDRIWRERKDMGSKCTHLMGGWWWFRAGKNQTFGRNAPLTSTASSLSQTIKTSTMTSVPPGTKLTLTLPDDFHHHFRDGPAIASVLRHATRRFGRAIAMPNLQPPVTTTDDALAYRDRILSSMPDGVDTFEPLMTLYLTDNTTSEEILKAHATGYIKAVKYYPAGATTNSDYGVTDVKKTYEALRTMASIGMILCIHSEVSTPSVDIFDREPVFIREIIQPLVEDIPSLKIVMEHISTKEAVDYVLSAPPNVKATITAHHLLYNRNSLLVGGLKPHFYCLPILKREIHREALLQAVASGSDKFFMGTDSAPHVVERKESSCGCAGIYTAHAAVELYAEAFERVGALDKLEGFCSFWGADFYGIPRNEGKLLVLEKKEWRVPERYGFGDGELVPLRAGETVAWSIVSP